MSGGGATAAVAIVLITLFAVLDLTGNIDWQGATSFWNTYQVLLLPMIVVLAIAIPVAYAIRSS